MHAEKLLHKIIGKSCQIDKRILRTLFEATSTLTRCKKLSIFGIARALIRPAKVKHLIKCIDRLFGNKTLHSKKYQVYQAMINLIIQKISRPIIVIDWSGLTRCGAYHFLRAAITVKGRTLTLYEQSYHISKYGNYKTHKTLFCHFYLVKQKKQYREKRNLAGKKIQCSVSLKHAKSGNEPWLIASSIKPGIASAKEVIMIYKKRMQIEESFRNLKSNRNGFSLRQCRSFSKERLDIALLIGTLAMFVLWLIGVAAKKKDVHYAFQSNTIRDREVLSVISIGWQALERQIRFNWSEIQYALQEIVLCAAN
jgi:hypothetical protein